MQAYFYMHILNLQINAFFNATPFFYKGGVVSFI